MIKLFLLDPSPQLLSCLRIGQFQRLDQHVSLLVGYNITPDILPEFRHVPVHVQVIILQLERQPEVSPEFIQSVILMLRGIGQQGPVPQTPGKQHRSLQINHLDVFLLRDIIPGLEQHIVLLPPAHVHRHVGKEINRPAQILVLAMLDALVGRDRRRVATQDGHVTVPLFMNGQPSPPQLRVIHHVIM